VAVDDGLDLVEGLVRGGCFGVFARNEVFDGDTERLGDTVGFWGVWKALFGYPPTERLDAYAA